MATCLGARGVRKSFADGVDHLDGESLAAPMIFLRLLLFAAVAFIAHSASAQATLEGHVELPKSHSAPLASKRYEVITMGGVLATSPPLAVVYLEGAPSSSKVLPTKQVAQKNLSFIPALLAVQVGTKVEFPNLDDTYHSVFSYSPAKRFDLGRYRPDEKPVPSQVLDQPGLVTLRCDIHEHMRGLILVLDTPFFATTDPEGRFKMSGLPSGHYVAKAWIDSKTTREHSVDLKAGNTSHLDFP